jgi:hypothetical protein
VASKDSLTFKVTITGVRETLALFRQMPKEANAELRSASLRIAEMVAEAARVGANLEDDQAALLVPTIRAVRDRVPAVQVGGSKRVGRNKAQAGDILFVSEFGANRRTGWYGTRKYSASTGQQHKPHQGQVGRWFFPSVEPLGQRIDREWNAAAERIAGRFGMG